MNKPKSIVITYFILRALVLIVMVLAILNRQWYNVFLCLLTLLLFLLPSFVSHQLKIQLPGALEIIILLFIFAAEVLGEIGEFYVRLSHWDTILHTVNGFLMAAIGFSLIDVLNRDPHIRMSMSPFFVAFTAFCFSMTVGVLWEFFEYGVDRLFLADMQKDTVIQTVASVALHPDGANVPVVLRGVTETVIRSVSAGETVVSGGYLDIGIRDTMADLLVNCVGALVFSVLGVLYLKNRGRLARAFIPQLMTEEQLHALDAENRARALHRIKRLRRHDSEKGAPSGKNH